jgi:Zn-dependent protease/predicted transcriptional regulator
VDKEKPMNWSWRLGKIAGIDLYVHFTFLILLGWIAISNFSETGSLAAAARGLAFILTLFAIVVLHELGHALAARKFGIATRDITLLPIGGVARLEKMPDKPVQELVVALAGPAVNLVLALLLYVWLKFGPGLQPTHQALQVGGNFLDQLFWVNVSLAIFNLLPAFPMDGGRVLRALLALNMDYVRATRIAAWIGQTLAMVLGFFGLFSNPFLVLIAFFVWLGAAQESSAVQIRSALSGIPVSRAMITDFRTLAPGNTLSEAAGLVLAGFQQEFPIVEEDRLIGILTRNAIITGLAEQGENCLLGERMQTGFQSLAPDEMLETVFQRLQESPQQTWPVLRDGKLVGILNAENLGELLMIRESIQQASNRSSPKG